MKVTLTFEVPNDFKRGMCRECPIHNTQEDNYGYKEISCPLNCKGNTYFKTDAWIHGSAYCPLEIQDSEQEVVAFCKSCKHNSNCQEWVNSYGCRYEPIGE